MQIIENIIVLILAPPIFGTVIAVFIGTIADAIGIKRSDGEDIDVEALLKITWIVMFFVVLFYLL